MSNNLSIIIPVYNEKNAILPTIDHVLEIMNVSDIKFEIVIVNDGSTDGTGDILQQRKAKVRIIQHTVNRGYGASIKTGIRHATYENIAITDADGTYPNERIPELFKDLEEHDMVIGARSFSKLPAKTKPAKWVINKLANYIAKERIPDINSGLRLFKKAAFEPFLPIIPNGFSLTTTITLGMVTGGFDVKFIPVEYFEREGKSKIKPVKDTLRFLKLLLKIGLYIAPLKIFIPFGIGVFILGLAWGAFSWFYLDKFADASTIIILMTSLQVMLLALIAELINHRTPSFYKKFNHDKQT